MKALKTNIEKSCTWKNRNVYGVKLSAYGYSPEVIEAFVKDRNGNWIELGFGELEKLTAYLKKTGKILDILVD